MSADEEKKDYRFLIVDDQSQMLIHLRGMLKAGGYKKSACVDSGREALRIMKKYPVDFIIADWQMPNMTGVELLKIVKEDPTYCDIPFLMITGEMTKEKVVYAVEEGVDGYLVKPISQDQVITAVRDILYEKLHPDSLQHKIKKLSRLKIGKKYDEALSFGQEILKKNRHPDIFFILGECYFHKKNYEKAREYIRKVLETKRHSKALHLLGQIYMAEGKYEEAIQYLKEACTINPLNLDRKISLGKVYLRAGLADEAAETFDSVAELDPTDLNLVNMGGSYLSSGETKKAGEYLDRAVDPLPETVAVFNKYAIELRKLGEYEQALEQYEKCLNLAPGHHVILYNLAKLYFEMQELEKTKTALENCLRSKPAHEKAQKLLGYVTYMQSRA